MAKVLRSIFEKSVDRSIDGVIKADDEASLRVELDEYVITGEIGQRLEQFLDAYNNYQKSNGVWISGFFGSGKSHLLKMLAVLLENREVEGKHALEIFEEKLVGEPMLAGALRKAVSVPSRSILFNIDQKADIISKSDVDALLAVFQKVFDEACGYYGKQPHIARFERDMDGRGQLEAFKLAYQVRSGKPWERGREEAILETSNIAAALAVATGADDEASKDILSQYRKDTRISIEDFANQVKAYLNKQSSGFRLNFFVDEVGQYIADNVKLMTNLQTVAESLSTKCSGQAWIIVTAQQALTEVVGDLNAKQENDFSKIQARFSNRMPLNSANVAEVIQKRLLSKTEAGQILLGNLYDREENNLKTLFDFSDGSIKLKNFRGRDHFISSYPFPSYQYDLFQRAIQSLSEHDAFEGRQRSVGERSMLAVFQEVSKKLVNDSVGNLATFDLMFEGTRTVLKSSIQQSIQIAERNLDDDLAIRILKCLFLVKYVKEFKPTIRNIGILLLSGFEVDQVIQRRKIEEALSTLENNTLIQRNGEAYEFLTNEEKDVEDEIKSLDVDPSELLKVLENLAFDTVLKYRKIKHLKTGNEYFFSRKLSDHLFGREYELAVNLIFPFIGDTRTLETVKMLSLGREELAVMMQPDVHFMKDLMLWKKTEKFIRQSGAGSSRPGRDRIVAEKGEQNVRRLKELEVRLRKLMGVANLIVRGEELEIGGEDPHERIKKGFQVLVDKVYVNLPMLQNITYSEVELDRVVNTDSGLFGEAGAGLNEAEQDILSFIQAQARKDVKVSAKYLIEHRTSKPYGWPEIAILCIAASLSAKGKTEARSDGSVLEGSALATALKNNRELSNIRFTPQTEFTSAQIRKAKELYQELFGIPADSSDARALGAEWLRSLDELVVEVKGLVVDQISTYPFVMTLKPFLENLQTMVGKPPTWYITEPAKQEDKLLCAKEDVLDKIRSFMGGAQRGIYDDIRDFLTCQDANLTYVDISAGKGLRTAMADPNCFWGSSIQNLKTDFFVLKDKVELRLLEERQAVETAIDDCQEKVAQLAEFKALDTEQQEQITRYIANYKAGLNAVPLIAVLRDRKSDVQSKVLPGALTEIERLSKPAPKLETHKPRHQQFSPPPAPGTYVYARDIPFAFPKLYLSEETDVNFYIDEMKKILLAEVRAGNKVIV